VLQLAEKTLVMWHLAMKVYLLVFCSPSGKCEVSPVADNFYPELDVAAGSLQALVESPRMLSKTLELRATM
jgi:hypothetical protein